MTLQSGSTIGAALGGAAGQSAIAVSGTASTSGTVVVDLTGIPGATVVAGQNNLITATGGLSGATYVLGSVYDDTDFTVQSAVTGSSGAVSVSVAAATPLANAFWKGNFSAGNNVWAISNGSSASNWTTNQAGTNPTYLTPGPTTTVTFSATGGANQTATVLGANVSVLGLVVNDASGIGLDPDGFALTLGTGGITINGPAGAVTLGTPVALGARKPGPTIPRMGSP